MNPLSSLPHLFWALWPWALAGAIFGLALVPLARVIPSSVLQNAKAPLHEWQGPGGGLEHPVPPARRVLVPILNACLWVAAATTTTAHPAFLASLTASSMASALLLLALIDWDTTMLPDRVVLPLGLTGLFSSYAGLTRHSLAAAAASAVVIIALFGGLAWIFRRLKGHSGIGGGDLKLMAALAAWWGILDVLYILFWAGLITVAWNLLWRRFKGLDTNAEWPFGPAIVLAALLWGLLATQSPTRHDAGAALDMPHYSLGTFHKQISTLHPPR